MKRLKTLKEIRYFEKLSDQVISDVTRAGERVTCKKNQVVYRAGEKQEYFYFLMKGATMLYTLTKAGNRKIIFVLGPGELLNESIIHTERTTVFCETLSDCEFYRVPVDAFLTLMEKEFTLTRAVLMIQEKKLWRTSHQLKNTLGSIFLEKKLAAKLWKLARDFGSPVELSDMKHCDCHTEGTCKHLKKHEKCQTRKINISLSVTFLADFLGAPRETTSRLCKNLCDKGLITMDKKTIYINDMECLARFYKDLCEE